MPHFAQFYKYALQVNPYCYSAYRGNSIKDEDEFSGQSRTCYPLLELTELFGHLPQS